MYQKGNEAFAEITRPSASLKKIPLTIFDLVDHISLPSFYGMLALSLHDVGVVEAETIGVDENTSGASSHLSITLPCKMFRNSSTRYNITVRVYSD